MRKFKYRAESYLRYMGHLRDQALFDFKEAEHRVRQIEMAMNGVRESMKNAFKKNAEFGKSEISIHMINDNNNFIQALKQKNVDLQQELSGAEAIYREKYEKLLALQSKLRSLELHKEKKKNIFDKEVSKHEQKSLDEMNSTRYGGKRAGSIS